MCCQHRYCAFQPQGVDNDGTRRQGDVEILNPPIPLRDGLVIDDSFACEFMVSSRTPGGWNNSARHTHDVLQARVNVKNKKDSKVYGFVQGVCARQVCQVRYRLILHGPGSSGFW